MQNSNPTQDRSLIVSQQIDVLLAEVNERLAQTEALYKTLGIQPEDATRYLRSHRISPAEREQAEQELAAFRAEVESEIRQSVALAQSQQSTSRMRNKNPNRIRI